MLNFSQYFLIEMAAASSSEANDDKGKMHELLLAKYLNPMKDENGEGMLPLHHRAGVSVSGDTSDKGKSPEDVHKDIKNRMSSAAYQEIDSHARQTAQAVLQHLEKNDYDRNHLGAVHWTSNRDTEKKGGDHEKTTGIRDPNANADLILTFKHPKTGEIKHVGVSAKHGTNEEPNYRNDGLASLENKAGLASGSLSQIQKTHEKDMEERLGYTGTQAQRHLQYKEDKAVKAREREEHKKSGGSNKTFVPQSPQALRARVAEDSSVQSRQKMARLLEQGFGSKTDQELRDFVKTQVSPKTKIYHVVAHSHVQDDGSAISKIEDMDKIADQHLNQFKNLRVRRGNGVSMQIVGDHKGQERVVADQVIKAGSGPHKGSAGAFSLNPIPEPKAAKQSDKPIKPSVASRRKAALQPTAEFKQPTFSTDAMHSGRPFYSPDEQQHILGLA